MSDIEITKFIWEIKDKGELWSIYRRAAVAPASLLQVVACSSSLQTPYNSNCCSCHKAGLLCTPHCHYEAEVNENTIILFFTDDSDKEYNFYFDVYEAFFQISVQYVDGFHFLMQDDLNED